MTTYAAIRHTPGNTSSRPFNCALEVLSVEGQIAPQDWNMPEWVAPKPGDYRDLFEAASKFLAALVAISRNITILVDDVDLATFSVTSSSSWSGLLAMLVLAFPEIRWVFMTIRDSNTESGSVTHSNWEWFWVNHGPSTLAEARGTPLFDAHGLRDWLRDRLQSDAKRDGLDSYEGGQIVPSRSDVAVVLDDEPEFRDFEALMVYSRGFRVHSIQSWAEAQRLLGYNGSLRRTSGGEEGGPADARARATSEERDRFLLSIEDLYLRFPDQTYRGTSDLDQREQLLPGLSRDSPPCRRFVSVGYEASGLLEDYARRKDYLRKRREWGTRVIGVQPRYTEQLVFKPASGLYALWHELGLERVFRQAVVFNATRGLALRYTWPIWHERFQRRDQPKNLRRDHSSPGRLVQIAQSLLDRAMTESIGGRTLTDAVAGAVLATDALELLGCRKASVASPVIVQCKRTLRTTSSKTLEVHLAGFGRINLIDADLGDDRVYVKDVRGGTHGTFASLLIHDHRPERATGDEEGLQCFLHEAGGAQQASHRPVRLELPPAAIVGACLSFFAKDIAAEYLVVRVAVGVEKMQRLAVEREQIRVKEAMSRFVGERSTDAALCDLGFLGVERCRDDDCLHAAFAEPCVTQDACRQLLVFSGYTKSLLREAIDPDRLGRRRVEAGLP